MYSDPEPPSRPLLTGATGDMDAAESPRGDNEDNTSVATADSDAVDYRGRPASKDSTGGWTSSYYIIGVEIAERFAYYGIASNLITYLTGPLGVATAAAAAQVNAWSGVSSMLPLLGGFLADSWLGRYRSILIASFIYLLGLGILTLSATLPALHPQNCTAQPATTNCHSNSSQLAIFFLAIYTVALGQGCHKPCAQALAADQFNEKDPEECKSKSSFFNWWYCAMCVGTTAAILVVTYVEENVSWGLGFGIPLFVMAVALVVFLLGRKSYRYYPLTMRIPFFSRKLRPIGNSTASTLTKQNDRGDNAGFGQIKGILKLMPIWATSLMYAVVFSQTTTLFTKQGSTLDGRIGPKIHVPPAALTTFISFTIVVFVPIYDRLFVPTIRKLTGIQSGITMLQRIGTGLFLAVVTMTIAALVEKKRLQTARDSGLVDVPGAKLPMSLWWLVPQYILFGVADVFTIIGWQEFFYDQVPSGIRSLGLALYLSIVGIGSFISSLLIILINWASSKTGESWFANNLNHAHIDYFYWLLAALNFLAFLLYLYFARRYQYKYKGATDV